MKRVGKISVKLKNRLLLNETEDDELFELTIVFLGEDKEQVYSLKAPGSISHARWMAKVIYSIKIALFRTQLVKYLEGDLNNKITDLALFHCIVYAKSWFSALSPFNAAINDVSLLKSLVDLRDDATASPIIRSFGEATLGKLDLHLWYSSERLVALALFSGHLPETEKTAMAKSL